MSARADSFAAIVAERRSVRGFLPDPVPPEMIERVFGIAADAPSNCNIQPWITHVASGATLERLRAALLNDARAGRTSPDVQASDGYGDPHRARKIGAAVALFTATGVGRHDAAARQASFLRNFEMFGAPHAAVFFMPRSFGMREASDVGMYVQTLMLALTANGLGSCAQGALGHFAGTVKRVLDVPADMLCLYGLSFGWPDPDHPSAAARTDRAAIGDCVTFHR